MSNGWVFYMPRCCWYANAHLPALHTQQRLVLVAAMATNGGEKTIEYIKR
jgi:hypothetical protein